MNPQKSIKLDFKLNSFVKVIKTNEILKVTRVDNHVFPICAGYKRYKREELTLIVR